MHCGGLSSATRYLVEVQDVVRRGKAMQTASKPSRQKRPVQRLQPQQRPDTHEITVIPSIVLVQQYMHSSGQTQERVEIQRRRSCRDTRKGKPRQYSPNQPFAFVQHIGLLRIPWLPLITATELDESERGSSIRQGS